MRAAMVILILIVAGAIGVLLVFSQQHEMTAAVQGHGGQAGGGYGSAPASGGYGTAPTSGGYGAAPASGGYGAAPAAGGYGAPASGGYGK